MKTIWIWEADDVRAGRWVEGKSGHKLLIGYLVAATRKKWVLIDHRDGAVMKSHTREGMAINLNEGNYKPIPHTEAPLQAFNRDTPEEAKAQRACRSKWAVTDLIPA